MLVHQDESCTYSNIFILWFEIAAFMKSPIYSFTFWNYSKWNYFNSNLVCVISDILTLDNEILWIHLIDLAMVSIRIYCWGIVGRLHGYKLTRLGLGCCLESLLYCCRFDIFIRFPFIERVEFSFILLNFIFRNLKINNLNVFRLNCKKII